jgi:hypothetical protein
MRQVNWAAVVVAAIAYFVLQGIWYTVFKDAWLAGIGKNMADFAPETWTPYLIGFLSALIVAYGLAKLAGYLAVKTALGGAKLGIFIWFTFLATWLLTEYAFEQRPAALFGINGGASLIGLILMGMIVGAWQRKGSTQQSSAAEA